MKTKIWLIGVVTLALLLVGGTVVLLNSASMESYLQGLSGAQLSGSLVDVVERDRGLDREEQEVEPPQMEEPQLYEGPRSAYVEEGLDLDTIDFRTSAARNSEGRALPRSLSSVQIQQVMNRHQGELLGCYAEVLREDPDLSGSVEFDFAVHPSGKVAMVKVKESSLQSYDAEDCFIERARDWQFPQVNQDLPTRFQTSMAFQY